MDNGLGWFRKLMYLIRIVELEEDNLPVLKPVIPYAGKKVKLIPCEETNYSIFRHNTNYVSYIACFQRPYNSTWRQWLVEFYVLLSMQQESRIISGGNENQKFQLASRQGNVNSSKNSESILLMKFVRGSYHWYLLQPWKTSTTWQRSERE